MSPYLQAVMLALFVATTASATASVVTADPLQTYLQKSEPAVKLYPATIKKQAGQMLHVMRFDSVAWRSGPETSPGQWWHWLIVYVPEKLKTSDIFFYLSNRTNSDKRPDAAHPIASQVALQAGMIAVEMRMLPNQPIKILGDKKGRIEDDLLARSWYLAMAKKDVTWAGHLPMVKAAALAMDSVKTYLHQKKVLKTLNSRFVVAGVSKRGWATWLLSAVRQDVKAFMPIVIDIVNVTPSMRHHRKVLGEWSWVLGDYVREKVTGTLNKPEFEWLMKTIDPYFRLDRLQQPKFIINAANDQFFLPDSHQFYSRDLQGSTLWRYVPNRGHNLDRSDYVRTIAAYCQYLVQQKPLPQVSWTAAGDAITVKPIPTKALYWRAISADGDFRLAKSYPKYQSTVLKASKPGYFPVPARLRRGKVGEHVAGFGEFVFQSPQLLDLKVTSVTQVVRP